MAPREAMIVGEMVAQLLKFPQNLPLLVAGYEDGMSDPQEPEAVHAEFDTRHGHYNGPHDRIYGAEPNAVFIGRRENHLT